jgi:hypothetical protein
MTVARAMSLAALFERLVEKGLSREEAGTLLDRLSEADVPAPRAHADALADLVRHLTELGVARSQASRVLERAAAQETTVVAEISRQSESVICARLGVPEQSTDVPAHRSGDSEGICPGPAADSHSADSLHRVGGRDMADQDKRNGAELAERVERERERLERERQALEREMEKLEREREKIDRIQEEMETRLERQEERLEKLEEELEAREEELEEAEEELGDLEVEGVEGIREMLDVVSDRIPHLMRGIQESVYSPERLKGTADAFASFYKTLVDAGMPSHTAAELTRQHFENLQAQMGMHTGARRTKRHHQDVPGPDFDPLGPNFDPFRCSRHEQPPEPAEPAEPAEPSARRTE